MTDRIAYMPLDAYPQAASDSAILSALAVATSLGCKVQAETFAVSIPPVMSPVGGYLLNIEGMAQQAEGRSRIECKRLQALLQAADGRTEAAIREVTIGSALGAASAEARHYDLSVVPSSGERGAAQDMAQSLVFDSGRPVVLVPERAQPGPLLHLAVAWDGSRVAARALNDALALLAPGGRISVLTVKGEKALGPSDPAGTLAAVLGRRGHEATAISLTLDGRAISEVLQDAAVAAGAGLLAMGGFGHSRLRDFVLGGATKGILGDLRLPVLLSH